MRKIALDLDGVLADIVTALILEMKERHNVDVEEQDIIQYDVAECLPVPREWIEEIFSSARTYYEDMIPLWYASEFTKNLHRNSWSIHIVTSRPILTKVETVMWLEKYDIEYCTLAFEKDKARYALENKINTFVEDRYSTAIDLSRICGTVYLVDTLYNRGKLPGNVLRISRKDLILLSLPNEETKWETLSASQV